MPSLALQRWRTDRAATLDEVERSRQMMGSTGPGSRLATQQLKLAYALLLSSEFQGSCRDLNSECARTVARIMPSADLRQLMEDGLMVGRKLQAGNPNPGNIGADFNRFGLVFWSAVEAAHPRNGRRKRQLEEMNRWRNAIAHNSFEPAMMRGTRLALSLAAVRRWRKACEGLARWFDRVMRDRLHVLTGANPW